MEGRGGRWRGVPQPGPSPSPRCVHLPRAHLPRASGKGAGEGLACGSPGLKQLHPLLQLPDVRL